MDQLDILRKLQEMMQAYEQMIESRYAQIEKRILSIVQSHYEKYGDTISASLTYNRLDQLKKKLDKEATAQYSIILKDVQVSLEEGFNTLYLMYTYLIYMYLSGIEGQFKSITAANALTSIAVTIALYLLKHFIELLSLFKKDNGELSDVYKKHKDDYVYNIYMDIRVNLRNEAGYTEASKQIKKRTLNARYYGLNRFRDVFNLLANYIQDKVYDACKEHTDVSKMWVSMRDDHVRFAHRILDSQLADEKGYFHYGGDKAKRPKTWKTPGMNWGCRCKIFLSFGGYLPRISHVYDYQDGKYLIKLDERIESLRKDGRTYIQALQQAQKEVKPPRKLLDYFITYEDWIKEFGNQNRSGKRKMRDNSNADGRRVYPVRQSNVNWSNYMNVDEAGSQLLNAIHTQLNEFMNKQRLEKLFLVDNSNNSVAYELSGESIEKVGFTKELTRTLKQATPNTLILTHVHPSPTSFSREDIRNIMDFKSISELTLECADGSKYVLSRGNLKSSFIHFLSFDNKYDKIYRSTANKYPELEDEAKRNDVWADFIFDVNMEIARTYGMIFKKVE